MSYARNYKSLLIFVEVVPKILVVSFVLNIVCMYFRQLLKAHLFN